MGAVASRPATGLVTLCGSLSLHPVAMGRAMHEAAYGALGLSFTYVPFGVTSERLSGALEGMRALGIRGLGISVPFKHQVVALLDELDPLAAAIGAVNTVVNDDGRLRGYNTDAEGAVRAIGERLPLRGRRVLVLGAGGAAHAIVHGLRAEGAEVMVANRSDDRARRLCERAGAEWVPWSRRGRANSEVIVNATTLGMASAERAGWQDEARTSTHAPPLDGPTRGGPSLASDRDASARERPAPPLVGDVLLPIDELALGSDHVVMDIVYAPIRTPLLLRAEARGARTIHGGRMLLHQAARQFELYTRKPAPLDAMERALEAAIDEQDLGR